MWSSVIVAPDYCDETRPLMTILPTGPPTSPPRVPVRMVRTELRPKVPPGTAPIVADPVTGPLNCNSPLPARLHVATPEVVIEPEPRISRISPGLNVTVLAMLNDPPDTDVRPPSETLSS